MSEIDFKLVPVDTLVDCEIGGEVFTLFYISDNGPADDRFMVSSESSATRGWSNCNIFANKIRISDKNPWLPWFGGECPVPPNCMVELRYQASIRMEYAPVIASKCVWRHDCCSFDGPSSSNIILYRLLESQWQTIDGVCDE